MANEKAADMLEFNNSSFRKHQVLTRYASGDLSWSDAAEQVSEIEPPVAAMTKRGRLLLVVVGALTAALVPPWSRQNE